MPAYRLDQARLSRRRLARTLLIEETRARIFQFPLARVFFRRRSVERLSVIMQMLATAQGRLWEGIQMLLQLRLLWGRRHRRSVHRRWQSVLPHRPQVPAQ
jgi:hypothetical protein